MGIDIPTIRMVIHYGLPRNLESFIQESGRAGRDGKAASSLVLYTREERDRTMYRVKMDIARETSRKGAGTVTGTQQPGVQAEHRMGTLVKVVEYIENTAVCRHALISRYFGQPAGVGVVTGQSASVGSSAPPASALHTSYRGNLGKDGTGVGSGDGNVKMIGPASSKSIISPTTCDFACDVCKEGAAAVKRRRERGLASDEEASQFTQGGRDAEREWD